MDNDNYTEIKTMAQQLFALIEHQIEQTNDDRVCETLEDQLGEVLKESKGFSTLQWAFRTVQEPSDRASWDIEYAIRYLDDQYLHQLRTAVYYGGRRCSRTETDSRKERTS